MKNSGLIAAVLCGLACGLNGAEQTKWEVIDAGSKGKVDLSATAEKSVLKLVNIDNNNNYATIFFNIPDDSEKQEKITVTYAGNRNNGKAVLNTIVALSDKDDKWTAYSGPSIAINSDEIKKVDFLLGRDFKVPTENLKLRQIKLVLQSEKEPVGKVSQVSIIDVKAAKITEEEKIIVSKRFNWQIISAGTKGDGKVDDNSKGCRIYLTNSATPDNYVTALSECKLEENAKAHLKFRYIGRETNGNAFITPVVTVCKNNKWESFYGSAIPVNNKDEKSVDLELGNDFKLNEGINDIRQIKIVLNASSEKNGVKTEVDVEDISIVAGNTSK